MKFIQEVTDGQTKNDNTTATWIGFEGIRELLNNVTYKVKELRNGTVDNLDKNRTELQKKEKDFKEKKEDFKKYYGRNCKEYAEGNYCLMTNEIIGDSDKNSFIKKNY